ncbi:hypothetical protein GCM10009744_64330 [Kribbella alba]|uniref:Uncharacterized protein n=1 Tax=Kribbella alba TaxID=190197 RepID=A0ABP4RXD9_9ACTN
MPPLIKPLLPNTRPDGAVGVATPPNIRERGLRTFPLQIALLTVRPISKLGAAGLRGASVLTYRLRLITAFVTDLLVA